MNVKQNQRNDYRDVRIIRVDDNLKINELITHLNEYNPDADITLTTSEDIILSYIGQGGANKQTTTQVFIEPCDICYTCVNETETYCTYHNKECSDVTGCDNYKRGGI